MAKQLNVNLAFTADTSQAKKNIAELQASLNEISSIKPQFGMPLTQDMKEAVSSAKELQSHLNNAFNTKTGNLDLKKLNASLKSAGTDLATLSSGLLRAGQSGEQAFMNIQRSVATASVQIKQANGLLANFWTTLKNTARWQFSSSMLHGFMGAMQSAYSYAKDLDASLNNIRIVTGYNTDAMAAFAEQANKAAKALSTTTTNYTDASLIFYQQGLKGKDVTDRANTVIKMANVTGEVAADVSDYMTAVWNNFYDGSKSLEYYADVMTALGAATASSTDEIAAGLEKFSAVADTVGLSYEYATAALATVTAETRQSADVVGTAFKTIFARIQGLNLGETLEDGVDLNKYSQALAKVGVDVLDATGQLKDADIILSDMAATWENLSKAQQVALAQAVGGVRQYNQIISLMDNWDVMEENLATVGASEGSLQEQANIYEESWAAASKRVKASLEGLYNDLIPTDFIIEMTNGFAKVVDAIDAMVSGFGGLQSILLLVSSIALNKFGPSLTNSINEGLKSIMNLKLKIPDIFNFKPATTGSAQLQSNIAQVTGGLNSASSQIQFFNDKLASSASTSLAMSQNMNASAIKKAADESIVLSTSFQNYLTDTSKVYNLQGLIEQNTSKLTAAEKERLSIMQEQVLAAAAQKAEAQATLDIATTTLDRTKSKIDGDVFQNKGYYEGVSGGSGQAGVNTLNGTAVQGVMSSMETGFATSNEYATNLLSTWTGFLNELNGTDLALNTINGHLAVTSSSTTGLSDGAREAANMYGNIVEVNDDINKILKQQGVSYKEQKAAIQKVINTAQKQGKISKEVADGYRDALKHTRSFESISKKITATMTQTEAKANQFAQVMGNSKTHLANIENGVHGVSSAQTQMTEQENQFNQALEQTVNYLNQIGTKASTIGGMITSGLQGFTTIAMGINSISNMIKTLGDESAGFGQKMVSVAMGMTMGFNALKTTISGVGGAINILSANKKGLVAANAALQASETRAAVATAMSAAASQLAAGADEAETTATLANVLASQLGITTKQAEGIATTFVAAAKEGDAAAAAQATVANIGLAASEYAVLWPLLIIAAVIGTVIAAFAIWDAVTVSAAEKTERLTENVQNMKDAASEAKEEAEGLKDAFDEYQNLKTTLEECTVGTTEWKEAMEGVKAAIDGILEAYPGLAAVANILKWDEGTQSYILDEDKVNDYIKGHEGAANAMSYGAQMAEGMLLEDRANYSATNFTNEIAISGYSNNYSNEGLNDLRVTDMTGDEAVDRAKIETAIRNDVIAGNLVDKYQYAARDEYGDYVYNDDGSLQLADSEGYQAALDSYVDSQMEANSELINSLFSIAETYREINGQAQTIYDNATKAKVSEKFAGQGLTEAEMNAAAVATEIDYDEIFTNLYGTDGTDGAMASAFSKGDSDWDSLTDDGKAILTRYEEAVGHSINWTDNLVQGTDVNRTFHITGEDDPLTPEEIATTIAAYEALGGSENPTENQQSSMNVVSGALGSANDIGDALITAITNGGTAEAMTNFLSGLTTDQMNSVLSGIDPKTGLLSEEALNALGLTQAQFNQLAEMFGISVQDLSNNLVQAGENVATTAEHLFDNNSKAVQDAMSSGDFGSLALDDQRKVGNALQDAYTHQGTDVMSNLSTVFQNAGEDAGLLADILSGVDWTSDNAIYDLNSALEQQGINISELGPGWNAYIEHMSNTGDSVYKLIDALDELRGKMASINEITGDLEFGSVISDEDYETLLSYNKEIADMFTMTADGWKFIGDVDQLNSMLETSVEDVGKFKEEFAAAQNAGDVITNYAKGWQMEDGSFQIGGDYMKTDQQKALAMNTFLNENAFGEGTFDPIIEASGYSREALGDAISTVANATEANKTTEAYKNALAIVESFYGTAQGFMDDYAAGKFEETTAEELWVNNSVNNLTELNEALKNGEISWETYDKMRMSVLKKEADAAGIDWTEVEEYAESLQNTIPYLKENADLAKEIALNEKKQAKGAADLISNYKNYAKVLKSAQLDKHTKGTEEYAQTIKALRKDISLLTGVSEDVFTDEFLNSEEVQQALEDVANGVDGAAERLKVLATMESLKVDIGIDETKLDALKADIIDLNNQDIEIGATINDAPALDALANLMDQSGMTIAQMQEQFNNLGWQPEIEYVEVSKEDIQAMQGQGYQEYAVMNPDGSMSIESVPLDGELKQSANEKYYIPRIKPASAGGGYTKIDPPGTGSTGNNNNGGGGGGSPKKATRKNTGDKERYHTISNQLEDLKSEYDDISEAADRAFGANKLKLMDAQIAKTDEMIDKQEEYLESIRDNLDTDKALMETYFTDAFGGEAPEIKYDANGNIENFDEIQDFMFADHDAKADAYEAGKMSEEEWQAYEEKYKLFEEQMGKYEESYDLLREEEKAYQDLLNQKIDQKLAKVQYQVELKLNVSQDELAIIEYELDMLDDKAFSSAERIEKSVAKAQNLTEQIGITQQALDDVLKASGVSAGEIADIMAGNFEGLENKNFTESQIEAIKSYRDSLLDMNKQLEEVRDTIQEEVTAAFEEYNEELDKGISQFEHYNSVLESYQNIIDIVGKDVLGISDDTLAEMSATQVENSINQLASVKEKVDSINKARDDAYAKMNDMTLTEADRERWAETYETMNEAAQEAQEELLSTWEGTLEAIVAQFDQAVQAAVDKFNQAFYESGLEGLSEDFSFAQEQDDMYLEDYQKIYELSKLTRDINKTMDDTKSIAGKQKLKSLMEDINKLQEEGVEMSQYDLEYLQAEYELRLAEIALEEAQRAKDTVRLSRDSEGNFSYVYTQNTDAVDEAQQKYEDALYSMQDLSSNYIDEMSAKLIETSQAMQEELATLRVEDYANIDEYYAAVAEVEAKYQDQLSAQEAELQKAIGNNKKLYDEDWANYAAATGYKISATEDFVTSWGDTTLAQMMGLDDATSFTDVMAGAAESLVAGLLEAANTYYTNVDEANEAAGTSTGQFAEVLQENIDSIKTESADAAKAVEEMATKMDTAMQDIINKTAEWQREHGANIDKIIEDNLRAAESYNGLLEYLTNNAVGDYEVLVRPSSNSSGEGEGEEFASGGYTGSWGASGKLAWLHEKELILNKNDTENMLKMIELTRAMISTIDAQANQLSQGMGMMSAATYKEDRHEILEQFVEIKADFPNVSNHTEIEEALGNLINTASQYAHRRK